MSDEKRLIDANALVEDLEAAKANNGMSTLVASTLIRYVKRCPTVAAVKVVHGQWVTDGLGDGERVCSVCKRYALYTHRDRYDQYLTAYCPNCGARMDGDPK